MNSNACINSSWSKARSEHNYLVHIKKIRQLILLTPNHVKIQSNVPIGSLQGSSSLTVVHENPNSILIFIFFPSGINRSHESFTHDLSPSLLVN